MLHRSGIRKYCAWCGQTVSRIYLYVHVYSGFVLVNRRNEFSSKINHNFKNIYNTLKNTTMNIRTVYMYIYTCGWVVFFFFHDPSLLLKLLEIVPQAKNVVGYQKFLPKMATSPGIRNTHIPTNLKVQFQSVVIFQCCFTRDKMKRKQKYNSLSFCVNIQTW